MSITMHKYLLKKIKPALILFVFALQTQVNASVFSCLISRDFSSNRKVLSVPAVMLKSLHSNHKLNVWDLKSYLREMESVSSVKFCKQQKSKLFDAMRTSVYYKLLPKDKKEHYRIYNTNGCKARLISEWQTNTGMKWPLYAVVINRQKMKFPCHFHHIIPQNVGGPHTWWNGFPVPPELHQKVVHGTSSALKKLLKFG